MHGFRGLIRPEVFALVVGGVSYCLSVWILAPNYLTDAAPFFSQVYGDYAYSGTWHLVYQPTTFVLAGLAAALNWRSRGDSQALVFLVSGIGAFVAFVLQHKGWSDHLLPAQTFLILSLGIAAMNQLLRWLNSRLQTSRIRRGVLATVTLVSCLVSLGIYFPARTALSAENEREIALAEINAATRTFRAGTAFVSLTDGIDFQFNLASERGFIWASRYPCLILPATSLQNASGSVGRGGGVYSIIGAIIQKMRGGGGDHSQDREYARKVRSDVLEDFRRWKPEIALVRRCGEESDPCMFGDKFDLIEWLSAEPEFISIWSNYKPIGRIKNYDLYVLSR